VSVGLRRIRNRRNPETAEHRGGYLECSREAKDIFRGSGHGCHNATKQATGKVEIPYPVERRSSAGDLAESSTGCDAHKKFSVSIAVNEKGHAGDAFKVHDRRLYREILARVPPIGDSRRSQRILQLPEWMKMEQAGHRPKLANPLEAKRR
jgi:hypothetical protein